MSDLGARGLFMLSIYGLVALNVSTVCSIVYFPVGASLRTSVVLWDILAACGGMLPASCAVLACMEQSPDAEDLVDLVRAQLGPRLAAVVAVGEWASGIAYMMPAFEFCAIAVTFPMEPDLAADPRILAASVVLTVLLASLAVSSGIERTVSRVITPLCILGFGIPLAALACSALERAPEWRLEFGHMSPKVTGLLNAFCGIEVSAFHLKDLPAESRLQSYYVGLGISMLVIVFVSALGQLLIAGLLPGQIDVDTGLFDAMRVGLGDYPRVVLFSSCWFAFVGQFVSMLPWFMGPLRGIAQLLKLIPSVAHLRPEGEHGVAGWLIVAQTALIVGLGLVFSCTSAASAFWVLGTISAQLAQILYLVLYWAAFRACADVTRWKLARRLVLTFGAFISVGGLLYSFIPPDDLEISKVSFMSGLLILDVVAVGAAWCLGHASAAQCSPPCTNPLKQHLTPRGSSTDFHQILAAGGA